MKRSRPAAGARASRFSLAWQSRSARRKSGRPNRREKPSATLVDHLQNNKGAKMKRNRIALRVILATFGILSVAAMIHATDADEADANKDTISERFAPDVALSLRSPLQDGRNLNY